MQQSGVNGYSSLSNDTSILILIKTVSYCYMALVYNVSIIKQEQLAMTEKPLMCCHVYSFSLQFLVLVCAIGRSVKPDAGPFG